MPSSYGIGSRWVPCFRKDAESTRLRSIRICSCGRYAPSMHADGPDDRPVDTPDPSTARMRLAFALFGANYLFGWPAVAIAGSASPWIGVETAALLGSASYALSWLLLGASIALGGREMTVRGRAWVRQRIRRS